MKFGMIQVTAPTGETRQFPLDLPSLIVGRGAGNGIALDDLSVSRRHARLSVDSGKLFVEDLGSSGGTFIGGQRLEPNTRYLVERVQDLRFGEVSASYAPPAASAVDSVLAARPDPLADGGGSLPTTLRATLESPSEAVEPGGAPGIATLTVSNRGRIVDDLSVRVAGIPAEWLRLSIERFPLLPGADMTVTLTIQPPRSAEAKSGNYSFSVSVVSGETGREIVTNGQLRVLPFSGTSLSLQPVRSDGAFTLLAENAGNTGATYSLTGVDDEEAFQYEFERAGLDLDPGERDSIRFQVKPQTKKWFGQPSVAPFKVIATPGDGSAVRPSVDGQLTIAPPLERVKRMWPLALLALLAALAALALLFMTRDGGGTQTASAEAPYAGVSMCDKANKKGAPSPTIQVAAAAPGGGSGAPFFAQNDPQWATQEYAKAMDPEFGPDWCGSTIAQCGCAMTSVATVMALFEIVTMPDGSELTPAALNTWLNGQATKTTRGWVSQGYVYGDVLWTAVNQLSAEIAAKRPGTRTLRFAGLGTGSDDEIRSELRAGRPIILAVPGHYIAAVGLDGDKILINDPFFRDRKTLDFYQGKILNSVKFEPSADVSGVVISAPSDVRLRVTDKEGRVVGTLNAGDPAAAEKAAQRGIPGASYDLKAAFRDPNCIESPPPPGAGVNQITLPGRAEDYKVEALNADGGPAQFAIHSYDSKGNVSIKTQASDGPIVADLSYDPTDTSGPNVATRPGVTPSPEPSVGAAAAGPSRTTRSPSPSPGVSPSTSPTAPGTTPVPGGTTPGGSPTTPPGTATGTPTPPPLVAPQAVNLACGTSISQSPKNAVVDCTGQVQGTFTTTRWSVNGVNAPGGGQTTFSTNFTSDTTATIQLTACNVTVCTSASRQVVVSFAGGGSPTNPPPPPTGTAPPGGGSSAPQNVALFCTASVEGNVGVVNCQVTAATPFSTVQWTAGGASPSSGLSDTSFFSTQRTTSGTVTVNASACDGAACASAPPASVYLDLRRSISMYSESWQQACEDESPYIGAYFSGESGPAPTGTVTFSDETTALATVAVQNGEGSGAWFSWAPPHSPGSHTIRMVYSGDANYRSTAIEIPFTFENCTQPTATTTALNVAPGSPGPGDTITLTATVTPSSGEPFGLVSFYDDGNPIGSAYPSGGVAQITYAVPGGVHNFTAAHGGSPSALPSSSNTVSLSVPLANSTTTLSLPTSTIDENGCTAAQVTVSPSYATGWVSVSIPDVAYLGSAQLFGGVAYVWICGYSGFYPLPRTTSIVADYPGDSGTNGSSSNAVQITVKSNTQTAVNLNGPGCPYDSLSALVIRSGGGNPQPQGTVTFTVTYYRDDYSDTTTFSATLSNGVATVSPGEGGWANGGYSVTVDYPGNSQFVASGAQVSFTINSSACY